MTEHPKAIITIEETGENSFHCTVEIKPDLAEGSPPPRVASIAMQMIQAVERQAQPPSMVQRDKPPICFAPNEEATGCCGAPGCWSGKRPDDIFAITLCKEHHQEAQTVEEFAGFEWTRLDAPPQEPAEANTEGQS